MNGNTDPKRTGGNPKWSLAGAVAAAVGATVCCTAPLLLFSLGIGGAWIGNLTAMEKDRPFWTAVTLDLPRAVITYAPAKVGPEQLTEAISRAGFPSKVMMEGGTTR